MNATRRRGSDLLEPLEPRPIDDDAVALGPNSTAGPATGPEPLPRQSATFTQLTTLDPALLPALPQWWYDRARGGRVRAARGLVLNAPQCEGSGTWRMRGSLRSAWLGRPIPVELQLWPRLGEWTKLRLQPRHRVHVGRRYFRKGHRALDAFTDRLSAELPRP